MKELISVIVYSFQNKDLLFYISNIIKNSSSLNDITIYVIDQNNINRKDVFADTFNNKVKYLFVSWDTIKSPIWYKEKFAQKSNSNYILHLGDRVSLCENWDSIILENYVKDNIIFSGNSISKIYLKNNYFLDKEKIESNTIFQKTHSIDRNFIFSKKNNLINTGYPTYLKYYGEQEAHTCLAYDNDCEIYAVPEYFYTDDTEKLDNLEYVPFSLTHNYNLFIDKYSVRINKFLSNISKKHIDGNIMLRKIPFENNDVEYDQNKSEIDKIGGDRYLNAIREIN